jgi:hypothetical protein
MRRRRRRPAWRAQTACRPYPRTASSASRNYARGLRARPSALHRSGTPVQLAGAVRQHAQHLRGRGGEHLRAKRTQEALACGPLPRQKPNTPSVCAIALKAATKPPLAAVAAADWTAPVLTLDTCMRIFTCASTRPLERPAVRKHSRHPALTRSNGAVVVFAIAPATPPAINMASSHGTRLSSATGRWRNRCKADGSGCASAAAIAEPILDTGAGRLRALGELAASC